MVRRPHRVRRTILCGDRPLREAFHITNASLKNNQSALSRAPSRPSSSISARKFHHHLNNLNQDKTVIRSTFTWPDFSSLGLRFVRVWSSPPWPLHHLPDQNLHLAGLLFPRVEIRSSLIESSLATSSPWPGLRRVWF